jgi:hypothetical protein
MKSLFLPPNWRKPKSDFAPRTDLAVQSNSLIATQKVALATILFSALSSPLLAMNGVDISMGNIHGTSKMYQMVDDSRIDDVISWNELGTSFI